MESMHSYISPKQEESVSAKRITSLTGSMKSTTNLTSAQK
eukprot:Gb_41276 [translate_table: standard]